MKSAMKRFAPTTERDRKMRSGISGARATLVSMNRNAASRTTARARGISTCADVQR